MCVCGCTNMRKGKERKSHDDFQLNGGNVTEINLHKYNMVRACWCHFICTIYIVHARTNIFAQSCVLIYI